MEVRRLEPHEVELVGAALGQRSHYVDRIARQAQGRGIQFVAWLDDDPIGAVYLWLDPADEPEIALNLPGVPLINT